MRRKSMHTLKELMAMFLAVVMVVVSLGFGTNAAMAAAKPALSKSKLSLVEGKSATLKVENQIKGSKYTWSTSNKKVATVSTKGVVKAVKKGSTTIKCTVKAPAKTYNLTCKVTVKAKAVSTDTTDTDTTTDATNDTNTSTDTTSDTNTTTDNNKMVSADPNLTYTATKITSIKYDFTVTGVSAESKLQFSTTTADSWDNVSKDLTVSKDGNYSLTVDFSTAASGLRNLGYFATTAGSTVKVKLTKITVNDTYVMYYQPTLPDMNIDLEVGVEGKNGLANIWNVLTGDTKIVECSNAYFQINTDKSSIIFYTGK